jgi:hypothetical protein
MRRFNIFAGLAAAVLLTPIIALAQVRTPTSFREFVNQILGLINIIIPAIFSIVFLFLVWKIFDAWVLNGGDEQKREKGKQYATVAVIVVVLMVIAWGVVAMLRQSVFGF